MSFIPDHKSNEFHMWLGYCIANWAKVDTLLFQVFHKVMQCPREQAAIVYYRISSLDTRLGLTEELVMRVLPQRSRKSGGHDDASVKHWRSIRADIKQALAVRRRIAHHPVSKYGMYYAIDEDSGGFAELRDDVWFELHFPKEELLRITGEERHPLRLAHLKHHRVVTEVIVRQLGKFLNDVLPVHVSTPAPPSPGRSPK